MEDGQVLEQGVSDLGVNDKGGEQNKISDTDISSSPPDQSWSGSATEPTNEQHGLKVRGINYLQDKKKIPAGDALFKFHHCDVWEFPRPTNNAASHPDSYASRMQDGTFFFVINLLVPGPPYLNTVFYFSAKDPACTTEDFPFGRLYRNFIDGDDEYRNSRFKLIPSVVLGPWIVKKTVGNTPAIMGRKLRQTYHRGDNYFEVDLDVSTSKVGTSVLRTVSGYSKGIVVDMAYVLEGTCKEELPERLFCMVRMAKLDLSSAEKKDPIPGQEQVEEAVKPTKRRFTLSRKGSSLSSGGSTPKDSKVESESSIFATAAAGTE